MKRRTWVYLFIALVLYVPLGFLQVSIDYSKKLEDLESGLLLMPGQMAGSLVMSGFKGLAADLLWLNVENYWHSGQHYKMLPLLEAVAWLQPTYTTVWAVGGWHMAYNIFAEVGRDESNLTKKLEELKEKLSPPEKSRLQPALNLVGKTAAVKEEQDRQGMAEKIIPEMSARLGQADQTLSGFAKEKTQASLLAVVAALVRIPMERLFWYKQGVQFLKKGVTYNLNKYDLYFELGWTYYHKGKDYPNAVRYFEKATKHPHPDYVDDVLAHAYEKNGQISQAIKQWEYVRDNCKSFESIALRMIRDLKTKGKATP